MLQAFSDRIRNSRWLGYLIVAFISVPFALWGIQAYFTGSGPQEAAEVNGAPISTQMLDRQVGQRRQQLREQFDGELPDQFNDQALRERVLDDLIDQELLAQTASRFGMATSDERVAELIRGQEFFQRDGRFDPELYRQLLARSGIQPSEYEADMRRRDRLQQLEDGVVASSFVLPSETRHMAMLDGQQRSVSLIRIPSDAAADHVSISSEEVRAFYQDNTDRFRTPPERRIAYVELDRDALAQAVDVTEEEIRAEYERRVRQVEADERREAAHILVELPADASSEEEAEARDLLQGLRDDIADGEEFEELAREHSDDLGSADQGGYLGPVERDDMVAPFEETLFGLDEPGAVSEPVRTRFGYHLIRLVDIERAERPSLDELRDDIRSDLQRRRAEELFFDRVDDLTNAAYENPDSLQPAAELADLEIHESDWFSRDEGDGIAAHETVRATAFEDEIVADGRNSDVVELEDRHVVVFRLIDEREPEPIPFSQVEAEVRDELRSARVRALREQWLEEIRDELERGTDPTAIADRDSLPVKVEGPYPVRFDAEGDNAPFDARIREAAYELPVPESDSVPSVGEVADDGSGPALVLVHSVDYFEPEPEEMARFEFLVERLLANAEMDAWLATLRNRADIEINERQLRRGAEGMR